MFIHFVCLVTKGIYTADVSANAGRDSLEGHCVYLKLFEQIHFNVGKYEGRSVFGIQSYSKANENAFINVFCVACSKFD